MTLQYNEHIRILVFKYHPPVKGTRAVFGEKTDCRTGAAGQVSLERLVELEGKEGLGEAQELMRPQLKDSGTNLKERPVVKAEVM